MNLRKKKASYKLMKMSKSYNFIKKGIGCTRFMNKFTTNMFNEKLLCRLKLNHSLK